MVLPNIFTKECLTLNVDCGRGERERRGGEGGKRWAMLFTRMQFFSKMPKYRPMPKIFLIWLILLCHKSLSKLSHQCHVLSILVLTFLSDSTATIVAYTYIPLNLSYLNSPLEKFSKDLCQSPFYFWRRS